MTDYSNSSALSAQIITPNLLKSILVSYFKEKYLGHELTNDLDTQRSGVDVWVQTPMGRIGIDLKACSRPVSDQLHLEVYSVRENRTLGYILKREARSKYILFVDRAGSWRMFRHRRLAQALRTNFKNWVQRFGVNVQTTRCPWRIEGRYTSSTIRVPTAWIRAAYYTQAATA